MNNTLDNLFHYISKGIVFVPIVIILIAVIIKGTSTNKTQPAIILSPTPTVIQATPTPGIWDKIKESTIAASFNLTGSFTCKIKNEVKETELKISNKQAYVSYVKGQENKKGLLQGDCVYSWDGITYKGEKMCGITPYLSIIESMSLQSILSNPLLSNVINGKEKDIAELLNSCLKKPIINQNVFYVPTNVMFSSK